MKAMPKTVVASAKVLINDISISEDSGWRPIDRNRVEELKLMFEEGQYGMNLLRKPSCLQEVGHMLTSSHDGLLKLADGKHTVAALSELKCKYDSLGEEEQAALEYTENLVRALTEGIDISFIEFPDWDDDVTFAWAVGCHDLEANKYKPTTLQDQVSVVNRYRKRVGGGGWAATQSLLEGLYGKARRMYVFRIVKVAQTVPPAVLLRMADTRIPPGWIHENKYFIGTGADAGRRLGEEFQLAVVEMASADIDDKKAISTVTFQSEYCSPLKCAETWLAGRRRDFGDKLCGVMSFKRVQKFLMSGRARNHILRCMKANIRLDGSSDEQPGIDQCRALVAELRALQKVPTIADALVANQDGTPEPRTQTSGESDGSLPCPLSADVEATEEVDRVAIAAAAKTEVALSTVNYYASWPEVIETVSHTTMPTSKLLLLVDAPTSKSKILLKMIDQLAGISKIVTSKKIKVLVNAGTRIDLCASASNKLALAFPSYNVFKVQLSHGAVQSKRRRPASLLVAVPPDATEDVPSAIAALSARPRKGECVGLRCMDADCPLRPRAELDQLTKDKPLTELAPECELNDSDQEGGAEDVGMGEKDDEAEADQDEDAPMAVVDTTIVVPPKHRLIVDLWPFAYGAEFYKFIIDALYGESGRPQVMIIVTTSAHPGPQLAAYDLKMTSHTVLERVRVHAASHGQTVMKNILYKQAYTQEKAKVLPSEKRLLSGDLSFVRVQAPKDQTTLFGEMAPDRATSAWRAGIDMAPASKDLESAIPALLAAELDSPIGVALKTVAGELCLTATSALKEGQAVMNVKCLTFSAPQLVAEFLNNEGNSAVMQGPLFCITHVEVDDGTQRELFLVPVGLGMYLRDFRGKKGRRNVVLTAHPEVGPNDGMLTLEVSTRNNSGIAAGQHLFADFGESFRTVSYLENSSSKRFRGALDVIFARQSNEPLEGNHSVGGSGGGILGGGNAGGRPGRRPRCGRKGS